MKPNIVLGQYVQLSNLHARHQRFATVWVNNLRCQGFEEAYDPTSLYANTRHRGVLRLSQTSIKYQVSLLVEVNSCYTSASLRRGCCEGCYRPF